MKVLQILFLPTAAVSSFLTPQLKQPTVIKMSSSATNDNNDLIEKERAKSVFRYTEDIAPGLKLDMTLTAIHHTTVSEFQQVQVIDTHFGRTLVTDGKTQSAQHDEFVYHESLVHPSLFWSAILSNNNSNGSGKKKGPKSVFIGGGGELATAREVLKHTTVERLVMVDIDPVVIDVCKRYLPEWGGEAVASHPTMELIIGDAHKYIMETSETFDVIIMDISDPIEAGPGIALYTKEFYQRASQVLTPHSGVFVTQAGSAEYIPHYEEEVNISCFSPIRNTLASVFDHAIPYTVSIASFGEDWGFVMAFNGSNENARQLVEMTSEKVDGLIDERIEAVKGVPEHPRFENDGDSVLKVYDGETHRGLFSLSKPLRKAIAKDKRIMTKANPIFMY